MRAPPWRRRSRSPGWRPRSLPIPLAVEDLQGHQARAPGATPPDPAAIVPGGGDNPGDVRPVAVVVAPAAVVIVVDEIPAVDIVDPHPLPSSSIPLVLAPHLAGVGPGPGWQDRGG